MPRFACLPRVTGHRVAVLVLMVVSVIAVPSAAADIPIETEAEYAALLDAIRAAEYTRQTYLETNPNPRAVAGIAGLWAFAERNPLATPEQLAAFVAVYDAELAQVVVGDETLLRAGSVLTALNAVWVGTDGVLAGTDTRVGPRAMELLGVVLPGLDGYEQSRMRMARFDLAAVQRLINRTETADALTAVLAGVDPSGNRLAGLASVGAGYLESLGFEPMLGLVDPNQPEVNAGLAGLPTFAEYLMIRDGDGAHLGLENEVFARIDAIQADAAAILASIGIAEIPPGLALDSVALFAAAADPDDPDHAAAVAELEARRQAVIGSIRETSDDRAAVFARTLLLQQSSYPGVRSVATTARSFAGLQLQSNNDLAVARQGVQVIGSLVGAVAGYSSGDPWGMVQSLTELVSGVLGLGELLGDGPPTAEEQIFAQIVELRRQVEDLRVQMNARFDIVDAKLDTIFETMIVGFGALGDQIGALQDDVNELSASIAQARSSLDRIEAALFGFAEDLLLQDLSVQTDLLLNYRGDTGVDLAYSGLTPNFVTAASLFTNYATETAQLPGFAGPRDTDPMILTLDNAQERLGGEPPVARLLNDLRRIPPGLTTTGGNAVTGPIMAARVPAPAPWSQASAAYAQLARESPWYFAYMLRTQQEGTGGNEPQIDQIIARGQRISTLAAGTRGRGDLFNGLLQRALDDIAAMRAVIGDTIDDELTALGLSNGSVTVDPWGPIDQTASPLVPNIAGFGVSYPLAGSASWVHRGYEVFISDFRAGGSAGVPRGVLAERHAMIRALYPGESFGYSVNIQPTGSGNLTIRIHVNGQRFQAQRTLPGRLEYLTLFPPNTWVAYTSSQPGSWYSQRLSQAWNAGGLGAALSGGNLSGMSYNSGSVSVGSTQLPSRIRIFQDYSDSVINGQEQVGLQVAAIEAGFPPVRAGIRARVIGVLADPQSDFAPIGRRLDNTSALLDAYLTLGMADAFTRSEAMRSAFRGLPSADGLGFRPGDILAKLLSIIDDDDGAIGGIPGLDTPNIDDHFVERILALGSEISAAMSIDAPSFPYVEFMLADLRSLRDNAFRLALGDAYLVPGAVSVDAAEGLMSNDIGQPGRIDNQDLSVDQAFFASPEHIAPSNGSVTVFADGAFHYTPAPGFTGTDSFNYRLVALVGDPDNPIGDPNVYSEPATVVIRVGVPGCRADFNNDGQLNIFDVSAFLVQYHAQNPVADFNGDGQFNFFDVVAFIAAYQAGCP